MESRPASVHRGKRFATKGGTTLPSMQTVRSSTRHERRRTAEPTYRLYVVRLKNRAARLRRMRDANPNAIAGRPVVYVGMTKRTREERFAEHMAGGMLSSSIVRRFGRRLFPWAYRDCHSYRSKGDAEAAERAHAEDLRARGWFVWQN